MTLELKVKRQLYRLGLLAESYVANLQCRVSCKTVCVLAQPAVIPSMNYMTVAGGFFNLQNCIYNEAFAGISVSTKGVIFPWHCEA